MANRVVKIERELGDISELKQQIFEFMADQMREMKIDLDKIEESLAVKTNQKNKQVFIIKLILDE